MYHYLCFFLALLFLSGPAMAHSKPTDIFSLELTNDRNKQAKNCQLIKISPENEAVFAAEPLFKLAQQQLATAGYKLAAPEKDRATLLIIHGQGNGPKISARKRSLPWQLYREMDKGLLRELLFDDDDDSDKTSKKKADQADEEVPLSPEVKAALKTFVKNIFKNYDDTYYSARKRHNKNTVYNHVLSLKSQQSINQTATFSMDLEADCLAAVTSNRIDKLYNNLHTAINDLLVLLLKEHREETCDFIRGQSWVAHKALCLNLSGRLGQLYNNVTSSIIDEFVDLLITKLITNDFLATHAPADITTCNNYAKLNTSYFTDLPAGAYQLEITRATGRGTKTVEILNFTLQNGGNYLLQIDR